MISTRYATPVIILLALALIPTILHNYIDAKINDGKSVHNIAVTLNDFTSMPSKRNTRWGMDIFGSEDWFERDYKNEQSDKVRLFTARAYNHKRLYHHPELALTHGHSLSKQENLNLSGYPEIPVHIFNNDNKSILVAYVLLYNNEFVESPIKHQLGDSLRLLVNAKKPMTLFYASQLGLSPDTQFNQSSVASLLSLAIQSFQSQTKNQID
ncbi:MAG: hypothetical protein GQ583_09820 [Methyloprofundus sp.]|nr:hypothetical protein [Methyloprofundus sp.]